MAGKRDWTAAREKVDAASGCRYCNARGYLEAAHLVPRSRVSANAELGEHPNNIVPLCRDCHGRFDAGELDLLPVLSKHEQSMVALIVGLEEGYRRLTGSRRERFLLCESCHRATTALEAGQRRFRPGVCGHCGGELNYFDAPRAVS